MQVIDKQYKITRNQYGVRISIKHAVEAYISVKAAQGGYEYPIGYLEIITINTETTSELIIYPGSGGVLGKDGYPTRIKTLPSGDIISCRGGTGNGEPRPSADAVVWIDVKTELCSEPND